MTETPEPGTPTGEAYDWFRRGEDLLRQGHPAAAAQLLQRALAAEPGSRQARETLARAYFDAQQYEEARELFAGIVADHPSDDYAHFGLGLAALRSGDPKAAVEHLSLAVAMKPHDHHYATALRNARAQNLVDPVGGPATPGITDLDVPQRSDELNAPSELEQLLRDYDQKPGDDANGSR
ncbi:tetratricopeptide repeat protein [Cryptosporangium phraense]|uniref:Tetratricopeptide repeat protein n=1 Tax=Cryptosporangium phraense TaxID=2593070 RepID=A0A545AEW9_9ACTN|nr:tetratricopeptide repeat protein [Cryptosporangium phraense]TQS39872.1 tetratricopeptide repeat protein [Cryptosporangium phraense]